MIRLLLNNGASLMSQDMDGKTCLHLAAVLGNEECFKVLLEFNPKLDSVDKNGSTPLQLAVWNQSMPIIRLILALGINVNHQDKTGSTALSIACQKGNYEVVEMLLKHGAHIYVSARNPIKLAHQAGHENVVKLLQQWSTQCYNPALSGISSARSNMPHSSKSVESFKVKSPRFQSAEIDNKFRNRGAITPTSFSSYIKNMPASGSKPQAMSYHIVNSKSASSKFIEDNTFSQQKNLSLLNNLNECGESSENLSMLTSNRNFSEIKSSRFKQVKEKLLRKSSMLGSGLKQSKSIDSSVVKQSMNNSVVLDLPATPTHVKTTSFRMFISSLNSRSNPLSHNELPTKTSMIINNSKNVNKCEFKRDELAMKRSNSFVQKPTRQSPASNDKLKSSKSITNSAFYQMIRKKLRFLKNTSDNQASTTPNYENVYKTDSIASSSYLSKTSSHLNSIADTNFEELNKNLAACKDDDVAYIFNRNSLNDCLNPRRSFKENQSANAAKKADLIVSKKSNCKIPVLLGNNSVGGTSSSGSESSSCKSSANQTALGKCTTNLSSSYQTRPNCLQLKYFKKETSI